MSEGVPSRGCCPLCNAPYSSCLKCGHIFYCTIGCPDSVHACAGLEESEVYK